MTLADLSNRLAGQGHSISTSALSQIANNARRVDVDDLVALAVALDVSPITLLAAPRETSDDAPVEVTGSGTHTARQLWEWLRANAPLDFDAESAEEFPTSFRESAFPSWAFREDKAKEDTIRGAMDTGLMSALAEMAHLNIRDLVRDEVRQQIKDSDGDD